MTGVKWMYAFSFVSMQIHVTSHSVGRVHYAPVVTPLKGHLTVLALLGSLEILSLIVMVSSIVIIHSVACSCYLIL